MLQEAAHICSKSLQPTAEEAESGEPGSAGQLPETTSPLPGAFHHRVRGANTGGYSNLLERLNASFGDKASHHGVPRAEPGLEYYRFQGIWN